MRNNNHKPQGTARRRRQALPFISAIGGLLGLPFSASAQIAPPPPLSTTSGNIHVSTPSTMLDLGTRFLRHLGTEAAARATGTPSRFDPAGGAAAMAMAADMDMEAPSQESARIDNRYRVWFEGYGQRAHMDPRGDFYGDRRRTFGGVAGLGMVLTPGVSAGISVDQSRSDVDVTALSQSSKIDLTQIGGNLAFESGPWTLGVAAIRGFGNVESERGAGLPSRAGYDTNLWGALAELSYYWSANNWRVVPKIGADWARAKSDAFDENGGTRPVYGSEQDAERTRLFGGVETGYSWQHGNALYDVGVYGRGVNIVALHAGGLTIAPIDGLSPPRYLAGVSEDRLGFDAGASISVRVSRQVRFYAAYDGRFRGNYESHTGALGMEVRW